MYMYMYMYIYIYIYAYIHTYMHYIYIYRYTDAAARWTPFMIIIIVLILRMDDMMGHHCVYFRSARVIVTCRCVICTCASSLLLTGRYFRGVYVVSNTADKTCVDLDGESDSVDHIVNLRIALPSSQMRDGPEGPHLFCAVSDHFQFVGDSSFLERCSRPLALKKPVTLALKK